MKALETSFLVTLKGEGDYSRLRYELMDFIEYLLHEMYTHERSSEAAPSVAFYAGVNISGKGE